MEGKKERPTQIYQPSALPPLLFQAFSTSLPAFIHPSTLLPNIQTHQQRTAWISNSVHPQKPNHEPGRLFRIPQQLLKPATKEQNNHKAQEDSAPKPETQGRTCIIPAAPCSVLSIAVKTRPARDVPACIA